LISGNCRRGLFGAERLHAEALRRRVAQRKESDPAFASERRVPLRDFARALGINTQRQRC
jgi:hypothetical protein